MTLTLSLIKVIKSLRTKKPKKKTIKSSLFACLKLLLLLYLYTKPHTNFLLVILTAKRLQILTSSGKIFHCSCALGHPFPASLSDQRKLLLQPVLPVQLHGHDPALPLIVLVIRQSRVMREPPGHFQLDFGAIDVHVLGVHRHQLAFQSIFALAKGGFSSQRVEVAQPRFVEQEEFMDILQMFGLRQFQLLNVLELVLVHNLL